MIFLYIYLGISILCMFLTLLACINITNKFKAKYPDLKAPKLSTSENAMTWMRNTIASFTPIFNLVLLWILVFDYNSFEAKTLAYLHVQCLDEKDREERENC